MPLERDTYSVLELCRRTTHGLPQDIPLSSHALMLVPSIFSSVFLSVLRTQQQQLASAGDEEALCHGGHGGQRGEALCHGDPAPE